MTTMVSRMPRLLLVARGTPMSLWARRTLSTDDGPPSFPRDENSHMKYWEHEYSDRRRREQPEHQDPELDYHEAYRQSYLTHVDKEGRANMVDVAQKAETARFAEAAARVFLGREAFDLVRSNAVKKGNVLAVAQVAGVMGAKRTSELLPLCHPIPVTKVDVRLSLNESDCSVDVACGAWCVGRTGVEMEALTGASVAALTVYDMCKAVNKAIVISDVRLVSKTGGKSGDYQYRAKD